MTPVSGLVSRSADPRLAPAADPKAFPFRCELSLAPLITFWTQTSAYHEFGRGPLPGIIREKVRHAPGLAGVIEDLSLIAKHQELVDLMMSAMFPPAFWEQEYGAALFPFQLRSFYATSAFRRSLMNEDGTLQGRVNLDPQRLGTVKILLAYELILQQTYGIGLGVEAPVIFTTVDPATKLDRHFQMLFDWRFVEVLPIGPVPPLTDALRRRLQAGHLDVDLLRDVLPPEQFVLRGFTILKAVDVTDQEVLSSLKRDLIDKESIVSHARFHALETKLRTLFRRPALGLGLAAVEGDRVLVLNDASSHEHACIFADSAHHKTSEFAGSLYERAVREGRPVIIDDLMAWPDRTRIEDELIQNGVRNFVAAPLHYQDEVMKRFDVDGAYDIRYEIVKKRIDKAVVAGTTERLTQPGKVAIVYSQPGEAQEYRSYIEYLQSLGYLTGDVEQCELGELQGVQGLQALRVAVDLENPKLQERVRLGDLQGAPAG